MSHLLINEPPLQVLPSLAKAIGLDEAIFLQQLHFWLLRSKHQIDERPWIYKTYQEWAEEFPWWSDKTIRRIVRRLIDIHLVESGNHNRFPIDRTKWYTIDYVKLDTLITHDLPKRADHVVKMTSPCGHFDHMQDLVKMTTPLTIDIQENTNIDQTVANATASVPPKRKKPESHPNTKAILDRYGEDLKTLEPGASLNFGQEGAGAQKLAKAGRTPEEVSACLHWLKQDTFWGKKHVSLQTVAKEYGAYASQLQRHSALPSQPLSEKFVEFKLLAFIVGLDEKACTPLKAAEVQETLDILKAADYDEQHLRRYWKEIALEDWRYKKDKTWRPTLSIVRDTIGKLRKQDDPGLNPSERLDSTKEYLLHNSIGPPQIMSPNGSLRPATTEDLARHGKRINMYGELVPVDE